MFENYFFMKFTHKIFWASWGVIFEGEGVQMTPRHPAQTMLVIDTVTPAQKTTCL